MHSEIDWNLIKTLLYTSRAGSLLQAAKALQMNHSTISRRLNALEQSLETRLLERSLAGVELTPQGQCLVEAAAQMEDALNPALNEILGTGAELHASLRISTEDTLGYQILPGILAEFTRQYPGIHLDLNITSQLTNLTRREADIIVSARRKPPEHLQGRRLGPVRMVMMGSACYLDKHGTPQVPSDLSNHRIIAPSEALAHLPMTKWLCKHVPEERIMQKSDKLLYLYQMVKQGLGLAPLPHYLAGGDVSPLMELPKNCGSDAWILTHPSLANTEATRTFIRFVAEKLGERLR